MGRWDDPRVVAEADKIRIVTGSAPVGCPWRAMADPLVRDVTSVYGARKSGASVGLIGSWDEAPVRLVDGVAVFERALLRAQSEELERRRVERRRERELAELKRQAQGGRQGRGDA